MKDCIFCNLRNRTIFENDFFCAVFDSCPASPGHSLVISKRHVISLLDLTELEWNLLKNAISETIRVIEKTDLQKLYTEMINQEGSENSQAFCQKMLGHLGLKTKPEGYNIGNNEGEVAGRTINHLHIHILPRYNGDVKNPAGGIRNIIPDLERYT